MPVDQIAIHLNEQVLAIAKGDIAQYGERIPLTMQKFILEQRVVLGMSPYEAKLAAGAFRYGVEADPKWPPNTDPIKIIYAQSLQPDESKIFMIFETETQFPGEGRKLFRVDFEHGKAVGISENHDGQWHFRQP